MPCRETPETPLWNQANSILIPMLPPRSTWRSSVPGRSASKSRSSCGEASTLNLDRAPRRADRRVSSTDPVFSGPERIGIGGAARDGRSGEGDPRGVPRVPPCRRAAVLAAGPDLRDGATHHPLGWWIRSGVGHPRWARSRRPRRAGRLLSAGLLVIGVGVSGRGSSARPTRARRAPGLRPASGGRGKNSAADAAIKLWRAAKVTMSYRGSDLPGSSTDPPRAGPHPQWTHRARSARAGPDRRGRGRTPAPGRRSDRADRGRRRAAPDRLRRGRQPPRDARWQQGEARVVVHDPGTMETSIPASSSPVSRPRGPGSFKVYIENSHIHARRTRPISRGIWCRAIRCCRNFRRPERLPAFAPGLPELLAEPAKSSATEPAAREEDERERRAHHEAGDAEMERDAGAAAREDEHAAGHDERRDEHGVAESFRGVLHPADQVLDRDEVELDAEPVLAQPSEQRGDRPGAVSTRLTSSIETSRTRFATALG